MKRYMNAIFSFLIKWPMVPEFYWHENTGAYTCA